MSFAYRCSRMQFFNKLVNLSARFLQIFVNTLTLIVKYIPTSLAIEKEVDNACVTTVHFTGPSQWECPQLKWSHLIFLCRYSLT